MKILKALKTLVSPLPDTTQPSPPKKPKGDTAISPVAKPSQPHHSSEACSSPTPSSHKMDAEDEGELMKRAKVTMALIALKDEYLKNVDFGTESVISENDHTSSGYVKCVYAYNKREIDTSKPLDYFQRAFYDFEGGVGVIVGEYYDHYEIHYSVRERTKCHEKISGFPCDSSCNSQEETRNAPDSCGVLFVIGVVALLCAIGACCK